VVPVNGVRVAVLGFSSYSWSNSLLDLAKAKDVVARAAAAADVVVVQVHMGAEGSDRTHVKPGTEVYLGEDRGDPIRFAHAVIDAGADLVVGHGPHVMRALEFYQGRLIAYSLGNFAGGAGTLSSGGVLGYGAILKVALRRDGSWVSGTFTSTTHQGSGGLPKLDPQRRGLALVKGLCAADFPRTGARLGTAGEISPPQG
jgi:Bacterial capsule synthesis protein PGA_cap